MCVFILLIVLDRNCIMLFFCTFVLMHVRKWSWCVLFVNMMSQRGDRDRFRNFILLVGRW